MHFWYTASNSFTYVPISVCHVTVCTHRMDLEHCKTGGFADDMLFDTHSGLMLDLCSLCIYKTFVGTDNHCYKASQLGCHSVLLAWCRWLMQQRRPSWHSSKATTRHRSLSPNKQAPHICLWALLQLQMLTPTVAHVTLHHLRRLPHCSTLTQQPQLLHNPPDPTACLLLLMSRPQPQLQHSQ